MRLKPPSFISKPALTLLSSLLFSVTLLCGCAAKTHAYLQPETPYTAAADPALLGEIWQKAQLTQGMKVGYVHITVKQAAPESGAVYEVVSEGVIKMGPMELNFDEIARLDGQLSQIYSESKERGKQPDGSAVDRTTTFERKDGGWVRTSSEGSERVELDLPNYDTASNLPLLLRRLPLALGKKWSFQNLKWGRKQSKEEAKALTTTMEVKAAPEGSEAAFAVEIGKEGEAGRDTFLVDAEGRLLRLLTSDAPVLLITTTEEDAKSEAKPAAELQVDDPRYPVKVFMAVLGGLAPAEALDAVVDWEKVHATITAGSGGEAPSLEEFVGKMKGGLAGSAQGKLDEATIEMVIASLSSSEEPDGSILLAPMGKRKGFLVAKLEGRWLLVALPQ